MDTEKIQSGEGGRAGISPADKLAMNVLLNMGEGLLNCGAEIHRVEDTLARISLACGAKKSNIFVITSSIVLTVVFSDGTAITQTRRIHKSGMNFQKLDELNGCSRAFCSGAISLETLSDRIDRISKRQSPEKQSYLGSMAAAGCFALFFGSSLPDALAAALIGLLICYLQIHLSGFWLNSVTFYFTSAIVSGLLIGLAAKMVPFFHTDQILIGDIMLLIPGIALTNSVRDMLLGDTISGVMRLIEALLWAGALACGFIVAIKLIGGIF